MVISFVVYEVCHWPNPHGRACPVWRPYDGLALAVATRLGVKLGTVVAMRLRSNAVVCFDEDEDWCSQHTGHSSYISRADHSSAAVDTETTAILHFVKVILYSNISQCLPVSSLSLAAGISKTLTENVTSDGKTAAVQ